MAKKPSRRPMGSPSSAEPDNRSKAEIVLFRELGRLVGTKLAAQCSQRGRSQITAIPLSCAPSRPDDGAKQN
jgi:hypothetical protein